VNRGRLYKPHFVFRPRQLVRRLAPLRDDVELPWGTTINVNPKEMVGSGIARTGIWELPVSETVVRLLRRGDTAVDVGANVGYFTQLMARCVGPDGKVLALEPHPVIAKRLRRNTLDPAEIVEAAASSRPGSARLAMPDGFDANQGTARLGGRGIEVRTVRLDDLVDAAAVVKLDCEGHELEALEGAERLLARGAVRNILFEEHATPPTPVTERLAGHGYTIFRLDESLLGPVLDGGRRHETRWDAPNYIASIEPETVRRRLRARGWRVLSATYWRRFGGG
jgi:FkbM family methyltransferase